MDQRELTLAEVATVLSVILVVAVLVTTFAAIRVFPRLLGRTIGRAHDHLETIQAAVELYRSDHGAYPLPVEYFLSSPFLTSKKAVSNGLTRDSIVKKFGLGKPDEQGHYTVMRPGLWPCALTTPMLYIRRDRLIDPFSRERDRLYRYMVYSPPSSDTPTSYIVVGCGPDRDYDLPIYPPTATSDPAAPTFDPAAGPPNYGLPRPLRDYFPDGEDGDFSLIGGDAK